MTEMCDYCKWRDNKYQKEPCYNCFYETGNFEMDYSTLKTELINKLSCDLSDSVIWGILTRHDIGNEEKAEKIIDYVLKIVEES